MSYKLRTVGDEILAYNEMINYIDIDPISGIVRWKVKRKPRINPGDIAGNRNSSTGYWEIKFNGKIYKRHRLIYWFVNKTLPDHPMVIDHIKGVEFGDGVDNLQIATRQQNNQKTKQSKKNSSGFRGVSFKSENGKWVAQCSINGKRVHIGLYDSPEDASVAYEEKCSELKGKFNHK